MPQNITDVYAFTAPVVVPVDADPATASSVNTAFQALSNRTKYLNDLTVKTISNTNSSVVVTANTLNTNAITAGGNGTGSGITATGGATGAGVVGVGGSTSGAGGTFTGMAGNANGINATSHGTGIAVNVAVAAAGGKGILINTTNAEALEIYSTGGTAIDANSTNGDTCYLTSQTGKALWATTSGGTTNNCIRVDHNAGPGTVAIDIDTNNESAFRFRVLAANPNGPNQVGDMYMFTGGVLKVCTVAGTGAGATWVSVGTQV